MGIKWELVWAHVQSEGGHVTDCFRHESRKGFVY